MTRLPPPFFPPPPLLPCLFCLFFLGFILVPFFPDALPFPCLRLSPDTRSLLLSLGLPIPSLSPVPSVLHHEFSISNFPKSRTHQTHQTSACSPLHARIPIGIIITITIIIHYCYYVYDCHIVTIAASFFLALLLSCIKMTYLTWGGTWRCNHTTRSRALPSSTACRSRTCGGRTSSGRRTRFICVACCMSRLRRRGSRGSSRFCFLGLLRPRLHLSLLGWGWRVSRCWVQVQVQIQVQVQV